MVGVSTVVPSTKTMLLVAVCLVALTLPSVVHATGLPSPYNTFRIATRVKSPPVSSSDPTTRRAVFGARVAMSADGSVAAIAAPDNVYSSNRAGGAYIFTKNSNGEWVQQGDGALVGSGASLPSVQGSSLAMSRDGKSLFMTGHYDDDARGALWYFRRDSSGSFVQQGSKLNPGTGSTSYFGITMVLSKDHTTLAVSSYKKAFAATIYVLSSGGALTQQAVLQLNVAEDEGVGTGLAISGDGNRLVIAQTDTDNPDHVHVFTRSGTTWTYVEGLRGLNRIGYALALSDDGIHLFAGPGEPMASSEYWTLVNGRYLRRQVIPRPPGSSIVFGSSELVMLSNGRLLVVGDPGANKVGSGRQIPVGAYFFYENNGTAWTQVPGNLSLLAFPGTFTLPTDPDRSFLGIGLSSAFSDNGKDIVLGAYGDSENGTVWFFRSEVGLTGSSAVSTEVSTAVTLATVIVGWASLLA